jgi:hypothetical protein
MKSTIGLLVLACAGDGVVNVSPKSPRRSFAVVVVSK